MEIKDRFPEFLGILSLIFILLLFILYPEIRKSQRIMDIMECFFGKLFKILLSLVIFPFIYLFFLIISIPGMLIFFIIYFATISFFLLILGCWFPESNPIMFSSFGVFDIPIPYYTMPFFTYWIIVIFVTLIRNWEEIWEEIMEDEDTERF